MAIPDPHKHIRDFLLNISEDKPLKNNDPTTARDLVNSSNPADHAKLKKHFGMQDEKGVMYRNFWIDFFDIAKYALPKDPTQSDVFVCCCSCCF